MAVAAILLCDALACSSMKTVLQYAKNMIAGLLCANYTHSTREITFHILRINVGSGMKSKFLNIIIPIRTAYVAITT